jgi:hypothetical protein
MSQLSSTDWMDYLSADWRVAPELAWRDRTLLLETFGRNSFCRKTVVNSLGDGYDRYDTDFAG